MRLLPVGDDHGRDRPARRASQSHRRRDRRPDYQHLPLRHVRTRAARNSRAHQSGVRSVMRKWTRRAFIGAGTVVGGGFVLGVAGVAIAPSRHSLVSHGEGEADGETEQLNTWIAVTPDNKITVL